MLTDAAIKTAKSKDKAYRITDFEGLYLENTFQSITEAWFKKMSINWAASTAKKRRALIDNDLLPWLGSCQIKEIKTPDIVRVLERIAERGAIDTAHNARQVLNQICSYAKQLGKAQYNAASDLNDGRTTKNENRLGRAAASP
jgi:hypothetical protein